MTYSYSYTIPSLLRFLDANIATTLTAGRDSSTKTGRANWAGTDTYEEAISLLHTGDPRVTKELKELTNKIYQHNSKSSSYIPSENGLFFDVAKVVEGLPEAWYAPSSYYDKVPMIALEIGLTFNNGVSSSTVLKGAAKILSHIKHLEDLGVRIKLTGVLSTHDVTRSPKGNKKRNKDDYEMKVLLKDYAGTINYALISGVLSPSFLRRIGFRHKEIVIPNLSSGYGTAVHLPLEVQSPHEVDEWFEDNIYTTLNTTNSK